MDRQKYERLMKGFEVELRALDRQADDVRRQRREVLLEWWEQAEGLAVGAIVRDSVGREYRVTEVDVSYSERPWVSGNPHKKDGSFAHVKRNLYNDWEVIQGEVSGCLSSASTPDSQAQ